MANSDSLIGEIRPTLLPRSKGGWLAVSPAWARFLVGVIGSTEEEARKLFHAEFARWVFIVDGTVQENT